MFQSSVEVLISMMPSLKQSMALSSLFCSCFILSLSSACSHGHEAPHSQSVSHGVRPVSPSGVHCASKYNVPCSGRALRSVHRHLLPIFHKILNMVTLWFLQGSTQPPDASSLPVCKESS